MSIFQFFLHPWISWLHGIHYSTAVKAASILGVYSSIPLTGSAGWTCCMQQRLFHSHMSCLPSPPSCPSIIKTLMHTYFSCQKHCIACFPILALPSLPSRTFPRMSGINQRSWQCHMTGKCWRALYLSVLHLVGREALEELPVSEQVWRTAGITWDLWERGKYEGHKKWVKYNLM